MKIIKKWLQDFNMENVSNFLQVTFGLLSMLLFIICLFSPEFFRGNISLIVEVIIVSIIVVIVWPRRIKVKKLPLHSN